MTKLGRVKGAEIDAQRIAGHASPKTTKLYDRTADTISLFTWLRRDIREQRRELNSCIDSFADDVNKRFDDMKRELAQLRERMAKVEGSLEGFRAARRDPRRRLTGLAKVLDPASADDGPPRAGGGLTAHRRRHGGCPAGDLRAGGGRPSLLRRRSERAAPSYNSIDLALGVESAWFARLPPPTES